MFLSFCNFRKFRSLDQRYEVAVEVRNNLVAASQNIQGAQNYLSSVKFPYCAPPEVDTLNKVNIVMFSMEVDRFMIDHTNSIKSY